LDLGVYGDWKSTGLIGNVIWEWDVIRLENNILLEFY
jgi:hypothetical protein